MNKNIANKDIYTKSDGVKNHQAYAVELSRLKKAKKTCQDNGNCFEYNDMGGEKRYNEVNNLVSNERKKDKLNKKHTEITNPNNSYQEENSPTKVTTPNVLNKNDHSGSVNSKILNNNQALNEELIAIKKLMIYLNNN